MRQLIEFIVTFGFAGKVGYAPGTFGTLASLLFLPMVFKGGTFASFTLAVVFSLLGLICIPTYLRQSNKLRCDPKEVVIDEAAGMMVTLAILQYLGFPLSYQNLGLAFILFRVFDITKIPIINYIDRYKNAWGIMFDDIVAGLYAGLLSALILSWSAKYISGV